MRSFFILFVSGFMFLSITACGGTASTSEAVLVPAATALPIPEKTPEVAYGASLEDWEDATQNSDEQETQAQQPGSSPTEDPDTHLAVTALPANSATIANAGTAGVDTVTYNNVVYQQFLWDDLVPPGFTGDEIIGRYADQLAEVEDGSAEAAELFAEIKLEFDNAPTNADLSGTAVRIPGFITPLEYAGDTITEFLLVPFFGACIHVPPPPTNQTVFVVMPEGEGIRIEDSFDPVWVMGTLATDLTETNLAVAGYNIGDAIIEQYQAP